MKINVFHLRSSNFYGGPERQLHIHALKARGSEFDITVGSFTEHGRMPEYLQVIAGDGISVHTFEVTNPYDLRAVGQVKSFLKKNDIKILCTHDYRAHIIGLLAIQGIKTAWVAFSRGWTSENLKMRAFHAFDKLIIRFADRIVAVSNEQKRKLVRLLIPAKKIAVAYNAIDPEYFNHVEKADLRAKFNLPADSTICLAGGRFSAEKGQKFLIKATAVALAKNRRLRFLLFGDGPDLPAIRNQISNMGIEDKVICPGFEKDLLSCLYGSDILVNPSLSEGLPNIVLEAMAFKIPVVATAVGGVPELIKDGVSGYLVPPGHPDLLAQKIMELAENKQLREKFINGGYHTILDSFSFSTQAIRLYEVYDSVTKG